MERIPMYRDLQLIPNAGFALTEMMVLLIVNKRKEHTVGNFFCYL